ncbi:transposase [Lujinxingia vulgaris]|uniref:Transposase n=1 Tax=Lujinxingia vulgaris TaxID=2600176 RepID=A0A5C6XHE9_9DELT|nr:helix-turn-helix domain-containing protein [Lujinxingia vulgaris]TXD36894.1 transposase [Lujinxingia vulgaris]
MGKGYLLDLRERVIAAYRRGGRTRNQIADDFGVGVATVGRWLALERLNGNLNPRPHGGGAQSVFTDGECAILLEFVSLRPDRTNEEYRVRMEKRTGKPSSTSTISREPCRLKLTRKEKRLPRHRIVERKTSSGASRVSGRTDAGVES